MVDSCYGCTNRQIEPVNCHSYCKAYLEREAKRQARKEPETEKIVRGYVSDQKFKSYKIRERRK